MTFVLGYLWYSVIDQLRGEWTVNPQYSYGWVVPFLCVGLLLRRLQTCPDLKRRDTETRSQTSEVVWFALLAFLWLPTRLVEEANPEWRLISWALAIDVVALTLLSIRFTLGSAWARWLAFPICFVLVAVPWPTPIEGPLIQSLTRMNSAIVVELLGWAGIPAVQHGNLIEVATGTIGVSEACSGIRSFQTSLMISLFFGEFYRMGLWRRLLLIPAGFIMAMAFNVCRMTFLTLIAAEKGVDAIDKYHDTTGITITLVCTAGLWGLAMLFNRGRKSGIENQSLGAGSQKPGTPSPANFRAMSSALFRGSIAVLAWIVLVELGVESWYRWHEARLPKSVLWSMDWPRGNPTFEEVPLAPRTKQLLRYDEGSSAAWREADGTAWQMIYFHWLPGRIAVQLAKSHTPEICLPASGHTVETLPDITYLSVRGLNLPFRKYILNDGGGPVYVFYCLWEDRARDQSFQTTSLTYGNRLEPILEGRRNVGQRSLEIVIRGIGGLKAAEAALAQQLEKVITTDHAHTAGTELQNGRSG
ncbi:MAG TPA: exosortase/archaeosortase family protein [Candidatus Baltobacteraceae bacterium]|nr:exosortase/archaeosortase family protein [Candidatus Baltobacteraceae bacterium]